jgi:uncharacterized damage-inducible protein DinB
MSQPLHPNVSAVLAELDQAREILREAVDAIPDYDRAKRPAEGRWSVNEVLEHLANHERRHAKQIAGIHTEV